MKSIIWQLGPRTKLCCSCPSQHARLHQLPRRLAVCNYNRRRRKKMQVWVQNCGMGIQLICGCLCEKSGSAGAVGGASVSFSFSPAGGGGVSGGGRWAAHLSESWVPPTPCNAGVPGTRRCWSPVREVAALSNSCCNVCFSFCPPAGPFPHVTTGAPRGWMTHQVCKCSLIHFLSSPPSCCRPCTYLFCVIQEPQVFKAASVVRGPCQAITMH